MTLRNLAGYLLLAVIATSASTTAGMAAPDAPSAASRQVVRELLRARRFDGAIQQLHRLQKGGEETPEDARLEATAWLGKAMQEDLAATDAMNAIHLCGTGKHQLQSLLTQPQQAEFAKQIEGQVNAYFNQAAPVAASWPAHFGEALKGLEQARAKAKRAYELEPMPSAGRDEAAALWLWAELYDYLAVREAQQAIIRADTSGVFGPDTMDAIRKALPADRLPQLTEPRLKATFLRLMPEAAQRGSSALSLALAECDGIYAASHDRLRSTGGGRLRRPGNAAPAPMPAPTVEDAAALLTGKDLEKQLAQAPESFLLPLYQIAAKDEKSANAFAASYGLYFALLPRYEGEASQLLEWMLQQHPRSSALHLEKARQAASRNDRAAAQASTDAALQAGVLQRPAFVSLPAELRPLWMASRPAARFAPQMLPTYTGSYTAGQPGKDPVAAALDQLRFAQIQVHGNLISDVVAGVWSADRELARLQEMELKEDVVKRVAVLMQDMHETTSTLPASLVHPQLQFSTYEMLPNGRKRPLRTLFISPTGFAGFSSIAPDI